MNEKLIFREGMSVQEFEHENTASFQAEWMEDNPILSWMIVDGDLTQYYDDIDRHHLEELLRELC